MAFAPRPRGNVRGSASLVPRSSNTPVPTSGPSGASYGRALGTNGTCEAILLEAGVPNRAEDLSDGAAGRREARHAGTWDTLPNTKAVGGEPSSPPRLKATTAEERRGSCRRREPSVGRPTFRDTGRWHRPAGESTSVSRTE